MINLTQLEPEENRVHVIFTCLDEHNKEADEAPFEIQPLFGTKTMGRTYPALFSIIGYIIPLGEDEDGNITQTRRILFTNTHGIMARDRLDIFPEVAENINLSDYLE